MMTQVDIQGFYINNYSIASFYMRSEEAHAGALIMYINGLSSNTNYLEDLGELILQEFRLTTPDTLQVLLKKTYFELDCVQ